MRRNGGGYELSDRLQKDCYISGQFDEHSHGFLDSTEDMIMREMQIKVQLKIYVVIASHIVTKKCLS